MDTMDINRQKREMRREIRRRKEVFFANTSAEERQRLANSILNNVAMTEAFKNAKTVLAYFSLDDELDTRAFLARMVQSKNANVRPKQILLPKVIGEELSLHPFNDEGDLQQGSYGIMEPQTEEIADYSKVDLVIVPGMAFDSEGHRLGRGKGYYDRLFANALNKDVVKIGVCYPFQMVEKVPSMDFDVKMDAVFPPTTQRGGTMAKPLGGIGHVNRRYRLDRQDRLL